LCLPIVYRVERSRQMGNADIVNIIKTHRPHIERTVRKAVKNASLVDDIVQDVCIKIYKYFQTHEVPSNLVGWLTTVSKNTATDHLRKLKRNQDLLEEIQQEVQNPLTAPSIKGPEEQVISKQTIQSVKETLNQLDDETRKILILRQQGLAYHEISDQLNLPLNTVKTKIFRGRKQLMSNLLNKEVF